LQDSELEKVVKDLLDGADLEQVTMKSICKQVCFKGKSNTSHAEHPGFDFLYKRLSLLNTSYLLNTPIWTPKINQTPQVFTRSFTVWAVQGQLSFMVSFQ